MKSYRLLFLTGFAVVLAAFISRPQIASLYDGVGFPDEPYRYVEPPANLPPTAKPTSATATSTMQSGSNNQLLLPSTGEQAPQASLYLSRNSLSTSPQANSINLHMLPLAAHDQPTNGLIAGNVYRLTADSDIGTLVTSNAAPIGTISLRLPQMPASPKMYYRSQDTANWRLLATTQAGNDIYMADMPGLGDYALVVSHAGLTTAKKVTNLSWVAGSLAGLVFAITIVIFIIRQRIDE